MTDERDIKKILEKLKNTYCRIKKSDVEGVGVFAIKKIPIGANPFLRVSQHQWHAVKASEVDLLDPEIKKMISDFFGMNNNNEFIIPECGLNGMDISFFLN